MATPPAVPGGDYAGSNTVASVGLVIFNSNKRFQCPQLTGRSRGSEPPQSFSMSVNVPDYTTDAQGGR